MFTVLFWMTPAAAALDWAVTWWNARAGEPNRLRLITKPAVMIVLIAWFTQVGGWHGPLAWFGLGLVFSLAGDTLLMFPPRGFLPGLVAFLLAHLLYITAFSREPLAPGWMMLLPIALVGGIFAALNGTIRAGLKQKGKPAMQVPVMLYAGILSLMWLMAISTLFRPDWTPLAAVLVSIGAGLFFVSDSALAINNFVRPIRQGDLLVMVTYHLAQILIAAGALIQYVR